MKKIIALELTKEVSPILAENFKINSFVKEQQLDYFTYGIIAPHSIKTALKDLLQNEGVFEAEFTLYHLENPEYKNVFYDFGFTTKNEKSFLYEELVIPFSLSGHNEKNVKAAFEQMDEHLIAIEKNETRTLYYVERYHVGLIEGVADAYRIVATFYP